MDRIFNEKEIEDICIEIKKVLRESEKYMKKMQGTVTSAENAVSGLPSEIQEQSVSQAAEQFKNAKEEADFDTIFTKLDNCKQRACSLIPLADKNHSKETEKVTSQINNIINVLQQMRTFLKLHPPFTDYDKFMSGLKVESTQWNNILKDANKALDKVLENVKGAELISQVFSEDPVNLGTGNFIYNKTDLKSSGTIPFGFKRFYNSINKRNGALGKDWNHNYEVALESDNKGKVIILEDGKEKRFIDIDGNYMSLYPGAGDLRESEEGYTYENIDREKYYFDKSGYYISKELTDGTSINLEYKEIDQEDKENQSFNRILTKAVKSTGEYFSLGYDEAGYLKNVTDHIGRTVCYKVTQEYLVGVCTPNGNWNYYGYNSDGKLESVQNARGTVVVENKYDDKMRTVEQTFPDGGKMSYEYKDDESAVILTERNGSKATYIHDEYFRDTKRIYSDGEELFEYNKLNQKTLAVDRMGNKTQYAYDEKGNLTRIINAIGDKTTVGYDDKHHKLTYISANGNRKVKHEYDDKGNLVVTEDAQGNRYNISYDETDKPTKVIMPDEGELELGYDERGNIIKVTDALGNVSQYEYDDLNRIAGSIDGKGNINKYTYDNEDNLLTVTNPKGQSRLYTYNESGKVTQITDFDGNSIKYEYNELNFASKVIDQLGRETKLAYDAMWNLARITEPNGAKTTYLYNENNRLGRIKNAAGDITRFEHDANGNVIKEIDANGNETFFTFDALNRLIEARGQDGAHMQYTYNIMGNVTSVKDAMGNEAFFTYDANDRLIEETGPLGEKHIYTYTSLGEIESVTDEAGRKTIYNYEKGGYLKEVIYPYGNKASYAYDENGNIATYTDHLGYVITYEYDNLDQVIKIKGSEGEERQFSYDSLGNVISVTDASGNVTNYRYSLTGKLTSVIDALGNETQYVYDECDRLVTICQYGENIDVDSDKALKQAVELNNKDRVCHITHYERDLLGNVTQITDPLGQKESYVYNPKGELIEKIDKEGYLTKYGYTYHGDIKYVKYEDGREVKLSYNPLRHIQQIEDWLGVTKIDTDEAGRTKKVTYPDNKEVSYTYGLSGERRSIIYPDGREVHYNYDDFLRLTELQDGEKIISYSYDEKGYLSQKQLPNGISTTFVHNDKGMLEKLINTSQDGILDSFTYGYDVNYNRTKIEKQRKDLEQENGTYTYGYDPLGRLKSVNKDGIQLRQYSYDAFGNRVGKDESNRNTSYSYNALNQLIKKTEPDTETSYNYDRRGNLTSVFENGAMKNQYIYGALNRLEEAQNHKGEVARYRYNGLGHRVGSQLGKLASPTNMNPAQIEESLNPLNTLSQQNFNPTETIDYVIDITKEYHNMLQESSKENTKTYLWDGFTAGMIDGSENEPFYFLLDELRSPIRLVDGKSEVRESYGYDEFGNELYQDQREINPFGYTGYRVDSISGTYFAQAREYLPEVGRFAETDLIKGFPVYPFTLNEYTYCWNSPLDMVDEDGKWPTIVVGAIVGGIVSGAIEVVSQVVSGEEIDLKKIGLETAKGAVKGAIAGTGAGLLVTVATNAAIDGVGNVAEQTLIEGKSIKHVDYGEVAGTMAWSAVETVAFDALGKGIGKITKSDITLINKKNHSNDFDNNVGDVLKKLKSLRAKEARYNSLIDEGQEYAIKKLAKVTKQINKYTDKQKKVIVKYFTQELLKGGSETIAEETVLGNIKDLVDLDGNINNVLLNLWKYEWFETIMPECVA